MIKIAVADDNEEIVEIVQKQIQINLADKVTVKTYTDSKLLLFDVDEGKKFDVYILDIEMPKIMGIDLAKGIRKRQMDARIIFLTSHVEFALEGFNLEIQAYQYILKTDMKSKLPRVLDALVEEMRHKKFYTIQTQVRFSRIDCEHIVSMHKDGKNVIITTKEDEYQERKTLEKIVKDMNLPELIFIERGYVINILHIRQIQHNVVLMDNGQELFISRAKISKVKQKVNDYWSEAI
ncbi:MAG: LytTR family DNA-binding domain-containing protein [Lachnospiraceae bacterium]|nr:LytTR family DNA-binding domain-containing protein [Lachnospiraceae bacterium]